jgi:hypothetical protein
MMKVLATTPDYATPPLFEPDFFGHENSQPALPLRIKYKVKLTLACQISPYMHFRI